MPPTPPPPRRLSRKGAAFKLACLGKQDSDENPLMRKVATPLKLAQAQVSGVDSQEDYLPGGVVRGREEYLGAD